MPPHLHPRSRLTTSLFGTTLLVSFLVVGTPHIFPCPAPRNTYMEGDVIIDEDGRVRRRRRRVIKNSDTEDTSTEDGHSDADAETMGLRRLDAKGRTCPFPKPTGVVGRLLGYSSASTSDGSSEMEKRIIRSEGSRGVDG